MTSIVPPTSPPPSASPAASPPASAPAPRLRRHIWWAAAAILIAIGVGYFGIHWFTFRLSHSMTDDAFVESHIVNVAPEMVSGRIVRFLVDENDSVEQGQIIAEIDAEPYRDRMNVAQARLDAATAELKRQQADLERLRIEVPIQIEI